MEQKIKQEELIRIGENMRRLRLAKKIKQTDMVTLLQMEKVAITREAYVKIERGVQHITASQLKGIRNVLDTTYDELLKEKE